MLSATIRIDQRLYELFPGKSNSFDAFYVDFRREEVGGGMRYSIFLHPKQPLTVEGLELSFAYPAGPDTRFFANGYQSWSESRACFVDERPAPRLFPLAKQLFGPMGDHLFSEVPRGRGLWHSWTYTWLKTGNRFFFAGSLHEKTGYTLFVYDAPRGRLTARKDTGALRLDHSFPLLDVWVAQGAERTVFDRYAALLNMPAPAAPALGWTSWYRHYTRIDADIIRHNLEGVAGSGLPFTHFQIDDGWQTAVGDWRSVRPAFPDGMGRLAAEVRARGLKPGLWLAPWIAAGKSELVRRHPGWLLRDGNGRPVRAGWNPLWGGWFYALDFYNPAVKEYLSGVFHEALDRWGYELVKLDFLYATALAPPPGKTRGQVAYESMEWLRQTVGGRQILACGVPLGAAFGLADYCRIGGDVHLRWEHRLLKALRFRERVSTVASLRATLGRWQLDGRMFGNDPDVFILRDDHQHLTETQQDMLLNINALLGTALFTSDDVGAYTDAQRARLEAALALRAARVLGVAEVAPDVYQVDFVLDGKNESRVFDFTKYRINSNSHAPACRQ